MATSKTSEYVIRLEDETSEAALDAANALDTLKAKIDADVKALREMQKAQRNLKGATGEAVAAQNALKDKIAAQKAQIASAQAEYIKLGGSFRTAGAGAKSLGAVPWAAIGAGIASVGAALAALVAATLTAVGALARYGIEQANARRAELLRLEGLTTIRRWYGLAGGSAVEMQGQIDRVTDASAIGRGAVAGYAEQLHRVGLRGADAGEALRLVSTVATVQGEAQARRYMHLAIATARYGGSVRNLAATIDQRLGGIARRRLLDLDVQSGRLRENLTRLFSGLRIEGFLQAVQELVSLFSASTAEGRALKGLIERILQPLIDGVHGAMPIVRRFWQGIILGVQEVQLQILALRRWWRDTFGDTELLRGVDMMTVALYAGLFVVGALVGAFIALAAILAVVTAGALLIMAPFLLVAVAIGGVIYAGVKLVDWFKAQDWSALGGSLVDGLIEGIRDSARRLVDVVQGLATRAKESLVEALGIRSPSRVFAELGVQIPRGLEAGIDAGAPAVASSVENVVNVPELAARGGGDRTVSIEQVVIHTQATDATGIAFELREKLAELLEGVAVQMGAPAT